MDGDAHYAILAAALEPPPGHEQLVPGELEPRNAFAFEMDYAISFPMGGTQIDALESAPLMTVGQPPLSGRLDTLMARRLVSSDDGAEGALTEPVTDLTVHPISTVGRITAVFGGRVRYCTGTVIAERLVLTAAHCAFAKSDTPGVEGQFANWMLFQPQFADGETPGHWAGQAAYVTEGWSRPGHPDTAGRHDLAIIRLDAPIAHITGTAGLLANGSPEGPIISLGYPRKPAEGFDFDGDALYATTGARLPDDSLGVLKAQNGLTEGSSGGPWFSRETGEMRVVGLNSTKPVNSDAHTWSPVFGDTLQRLIARALADMTGV